jgi:hypothetical protein
MLNIAFFTCNLHKDAELKIDPFGNSYVRLNVYTNQNIHYESFTMRQTVVMFGRMAEEGSKLRKGDFIEIVGKRLPLHRLDTDGTIHIEEDIQAYEIFIISSKETFEKRHISCLDNDSPEPNSADLENLISMDQQRAADTPRAPE